MVGDLLSLRGAMATLQSGAELNWIAASLSLLVMTI
jgi:hypothetical protein